MTVLIAGADGQLALACRSRMASQHRVVALTRAQLDVTDYDGVVEAVGEIRPQVVINGAAYNDVDGAEDDPAGALSVNAFGVRALAKAAQAVGATLVHYSTDFVFDGSATEPYAETALPNPQSVYATSKLLGEWFAREADHHYVLRVESLFGGSVARRDDGRTRGSSLDRLADAMLSGQEVRAFADRTVSPSFVEDVADATVALLKGRAPFGLYHCVGTGHATWVEVATELAHGLRCAATIVPVTLADVELRASRPTYCALSNAKLAGVGVSMPTWQDAVGRFAASRVTDHRTS